MTDDLSRDLEQVQVPAIPNDYAALKTLIQTLPAPLSPEIRSATTGITNTATPGVTTAAQTAGVMAGAPIGMESGSSVGVVSEIFYGNSNMLQNPLLDTTVGTCPNFATTNTPFAREWQGKYALNSGSLPHYIGTDQLYQRGAYSSNPLNSTLMEMWLEADAGATDFTAYLYPLYGPTPNTDLAFPFLVASAKVGWWGNPIRPNTDKFRIRMEILDDDGLVAGPWFDMKAVAGSGAVYRISVAKPMPPGGWSSSGKSPYLWRMAINWAQLAGAPAGYDWFVWGEPALAWSSTQAPPPFAPIIGGWVPNELLSRDFGDTSDRVRVGSGGLAIMPGNGSGFGFISVTSDGVYMGGGTTWSDVLLSRAASRTLRISDPYGYGTGNETLQLGSDTNLYRGGADNLKTDDSLTVLGDLKVGDGTQGEPWVTVKRDSTGGGEGGLEILRTSDSHRRVAVMTEFWGEGSVRFGSGSTYEDVRIIRPANKTLRVDDSNGGGAVLVVVPSSAQTLIASSAILANANVVQINSAGNITLTSVPTIADGIDGQMLTILNVDSADTIYLQDQGSLGGSNLRLTATNVGIGPRDSIQLMYSSTIGDWVQIGALVSVL